MSPLFFLIRKSLKNIIKSAFKKPLVLIGYLFVLLLLGGSLALAFFMPSGSVNQNPPEMFKGIMVLASGVLYYSTLKMGIDKGSSYFRMADVNLVFPSPLKGNHVLLYGFLKQLAGTLLFIYLAVAQIPNLKNNFMINNYGVWMILLAVVMYSLAFPLVSIAIYSWTTKVKVRKVWAKRVLDIVALAAVLVFILRLSASGQFAVALQEVFGSPAAQYFPLIGWTAAIASAGVTGFTFPAVFGLSAMLLVIVGLLISFLRMKVDYYEDVLEATEYAETVLKAKKEGNTMGLNTKIKSNVKQKLNGTGARVLFSKQILELRKTSFFLFLDRTSITIILSAVIFKLVMPDEAGTMNLIIILAFSVYMLLLFQMQGRLGQELSKPYIFLIPDSPARKLFYTTLPEHVKNLFDGAVLFILSGILFKANPLLVPACIITYVLFGAVFTYTDVLCRRLFGSVHSKALLIFIKAIAALLVELPGIIAAVIVLVISGSQLLCIITMGGWSFTLAFMLFMFSQGIFKNLESAG